MFFDPNVLWLMTGPVAFCERLVAPSSKDVEVTKSSVEYLIWAYMLVVPPPAIYISIVVTFKLYEAAAVMAYST